ncbi:hypothetical protein GCM10027448_13390 [Nocardioides dilutus]
MLGSVGFAGTAYGASLTAKQVKKIAAKVVKNKAPKLSVKHAGTADSATTAGTAGNAANLGGQPATTYLDRVAFEALNNSVQTDGGVTQQVLNPTVIEVPSGVGFVRVDTVVSFSSPAVLLFMWISKGTCQNSGDDFNHRQMGSTEGTQTSVSATRVYAVPAGPSSFRVCVWTTGDSAVTNRSITIQTVAGDFNG